MAGLNKIMLIGGLGRDPEINYAQSGTAIASISIATSETWNDKNTGERKEKTEWHRVKAFGKQAETIGKYMKKGSQIYVEGKLQTSQYEKDGITRYSTEIIVEKFQFIGSKQDNNQSTGHQPQQNQGFNQQPQYQQRQENTGYQAPPRNQEQDQDLPF